MPTFIDEETGLPGFSYDLAPEDPANPDQVPVADFSTPPRDPENEIEHEGVVALGGEKTWNYGEQPPRDPDFDDPDDIPDPDKPQPPIEEPEGDEDDNDQPSGNPEDDEHIPS